MGKESRWLPRLQVIENVENGMAKGGVEEVLSSSFEARPWFSEASAAGMTANSSHMTDSVITEG